MEHPTNGVIPNMFVSAVDLTIHAVAIGEEDSVSLTVTYLHMNRMGTARIKA